MLYQPSADLYDRIINRINREEQLVILKRGLILRFFGIFITFPVFALLSWKFLVDITDSGLTQFLSLFLTDFNIVMGNLSDYVLAILESAPSINLSLALTALLVLVFNLAKLADCYSDFKKIAVQNI